MQLIAFNTALVSLVGDHAAAAVLSQIIYWHRGRLRVKWNDRYWLAKPRYEMCAETGITLDQYKRIMPLLVQQGWITTERHLFKNKVTPFIRLTAKGLGLMNSNGVVVKATNTLEGITSNLSTKTTTETVAERILQRPQAQERGEDKQDPRATRRRKKEDQKIDQDRREDPSLICQEGSGMNAKEILAKQEASTNGSVGAYWKSRCALVSGGYQRALTGKEIGQLKLLSKALGEQTKPVIAYVIEHWWKFASRAGATAGTMFPSDPHIGFLLKHYPVAVNLLMPVAASPPPAEVPVQLIAPQMVEEPVHEVTSKELTELLDGLKSP